MAPNCIKGDSISPYKRISQNGNSSKSLSFFLASHNVCKREEIFSVKRRCVSLIFRLIFSNTGGIHTGLGESSSFKNPARRISSKPIKKIVTDRTISMEFPIILLYIANNRTTFFFSTTKVYKTNKTPISMSSFIWPRGLKFCYRKDFSIKKSLSRFRKLFYFSV